jgi:hypothetical protein
MGDQANAILRERRMAFEYPTDARVLRLVRRKRRWTFRFNGRENGAWCSPDEAATAVARHQSGLAEWDQGRLDVPEDLLKWRPLGESM